MKIRNPWRSLWCGIIFGPLLSVSTVCAHEVRPAYLQLHQSGVETYDVFWKVPGRGDNMRLSLDVEMPKNCSNTSNHRGVFGDNTFIEEWRLITSHQHVILIDADFPAPNIAYGLFGKLGLLLCEFTTRSAFPSPTRRVTMQAHYET